MLAGGLKKESGWAKVVSMAMSRTDNNYLLCDEITILSPLQWVFINIFPYLLISHIFFYDLVMK